MVSVLLLVLVLVLVLVSVLVGLRRRSSWCCCGDGAAEASHRLPVPNNAGLVLTVIIFFLDVMFALVLLLMLMLPKLLPLCGWCFFLLETVMLAVVLEVVALALLYSCFETCWRSHLSHTYGARCGTGGGGGHGRCGVEVATSVGHDDSSCGVRTLSRCDFGNYGIRCGVGDGLPWCRLSCWAGLGTRHLRCW